MSLLFDSHVVLDLELSYPREGVWSATALFWNDDAPEINTNASLTIDDVSLNGTVVSLGSNEEHIICNIVGGKGTLTNKPSKAKHFSGTTGKNILNNLFVSLQDSLNLIPANINSYTIDQWEILKDVSYGKQLSRFVNIFDDVVWRVNENGTIDIVNDVNNTFNLTDDYILQNTRADGSEIYEVTELKKMIYPGMTVNDNFIEEVILKASNDYIELQLLKNRFIDVLDDVLNRNHRELFQQTYIAYVDSQNSDGTLNVVSEDNRIKGTGLKNVPVVYSANQRAKDIPQNTKCVVGYSSSNPQNIYVLGFFVDDLDQAVNIFGNPNSAEFVALANLVLDELKKVKQDLSAQKQTFDTHIHPFTQAPSGPAVTTPPNSTAPPTAGTAIKFPEPHEPESVSASKLKTE